MPRYAKALNCKTVSYTENKKAGNNPVTGEIQRKVTVTTKYTLFKKLYDLMYRELDAKNYDLAEKYWQQIIALKNAGWTASMVAKLAYFASIVSAAWH